MFRKKRPKPTDSIPGLTRAQAMALVPVKSAQVRVSHTMDGLVRLEYPATVTPWFAGVAKRMGLWDGRPIYKKLELDKIGSQSWEWIDEQRSVGQLAQLLAQTYELVPREAEVAMGAFVRELGRRGIVALKEPGKE